MRALVDGVAFLLELCALAAVAYRGHVIGGAWPAVVFPLAFAVVWGVFCSPKRRIDFGRWPTFALRVVLLLAAAAALGGRLGIALAVAVVLDNAALLLARG